MNCVTEQRPQDPEQVARVAALADAAQAATKVNFAEKFNPSGLPEYALNSAETALRHAARGLDTKLAPAVQDTQERALFAWQTRRLTEDAPSLVREPAGLLDAFQSAITGLADTSLAAPGDVMRALLDAYSFDEGPPAPETTATRARERANQLALTAALRRTLAIAAARLAPLVPYTSIEEATAARHQVAAHLDEQAASAGDTAYQALVALRGEVQRAVPGSRMFPQIITITQSEPIPALVLSHRLYGTVDMADDIVVRNGIRHPGFVSGELKVIAPTDRDRRR